MGAYLSNASTHPKSVNGHAMVYIPLPIRFKLMECMDIAEELKGQPPTGMDIYIVACERFGNRHEIIQYPWFCAFLQNMYREDKFYADPNFTCWTHRGAHLDGFELFSDRFRKFYPGYILDKNMRVRALPETKVVNLDFLYNLLRSKDEKLWNENKWIFDGQMRFLDGQQNSWNKVAFASFPRSGNSFLRKYLEMLTGVTTGSDNTLHVNVILQLAGLKGEHIVDDTVWIAKTHSPYIMVDQPPMAVNKIISIVRNPMDVIPSWLSLTMLFTHGQKVPFEPQDYTEWWTWQIQHNSKCAGQWYSTTMDAGIQNKNEAPVLWVRFEDLVSDPGMCLRQIMRFILNLDSLEGTNAERRVQEVLAKGKSATQSYTLKDSTLKFNANSKRYTEEHTEIIKKNMSRMLYYFGYMKNPEDPTREEMTGFYEKDNHDANMLKTHGQFREDNESTIKHCSEASRERMEKYQYQCLDMAKEVDLYNPDFAKTATIPLVDYTQKLLYPEKYLKEE